MVKKQNKKKKIVFVGHIYETTSEESKKDNTTNANKIRPKEEIGKFLLSIPKDLRRDIKFESDEKGFGNVSDYICHILKKRNVIF